MHPNYSGRGWNALTRNQQIAVIVIGILVLFAVVSGAGSFGRLGDPTWIVAAAAIILVALPVHEMAHAATAVALGDPTPRYQGRFTVNPMAHIDPMGALFILLTGFGWAKPVQWDPRHIHVDVRLGAILVAVAGPLSNLVLAAFSIFLLRFVSVDLAVRFLLFFAQINVLLFVFNLIPVPPLDGSHVLFALLPGDTFGLRMALGRYGFLILILIIFLASSIITAPAGAILRFLFGLIGA